jgi:two-component system, NarL family, nitrate/nitrite response regulator NarL
LAQSIARSFEVSIVLSEVWTYLVGEVLLSSISLIVGFSQQAALALLEAATIDWKEDMTNPDQGRIRLMLLGPPGLLRAALGRLLASHPDFEVVQECANSAEALELLGRLPVDLVLLDFDSDAGQGADLLLKARTSGYRGRFLVLTGAPDVRNCSLSLKLGAAGIFLKSDAPERLAEAIRTVAQGGSWIYDEALQLIVNQLIEQRPTIDSRLDQRLDSEEQRVLLGIIGGLSNRKIASKSGVSENFVKNIVQRLFRKAGVKNRSQLVRVALSGSAHASQKDAPVGLAPRQRCDLL